MVRDSQPGNLLEPCVETRVLRDGGATKVTVASGFTVLVLALLSISLWLGSVPPEPTGLGRKAAVDSFIVQGATFDLVRRAVLDSGGTITHELRIIEAIAADLSPRQRRDLEGHAAVRRIFENAAVETGAVRGDQPSGRDGRPAETPPDVTFPSRVRADQAHHLGLTGAGVTVAVIDSGIWNTPALSENSAGNRRLLAYYDAIENHHKLRSDPYGHGSHVTGVLADSSRGNRNERKAFNSIAPDVDLVVVRAFDDTGKGCYADVIRGLEWLLNHQDRFGVRIANLSFGAPPRSYYWDDPLNQAVMALWRAGVAVVTAAGNGGPDPMTVTVPGNVPYVITVGAMSDAFTPEDPGDDYLTTFSAAGPTAEGFVKPDLVAPGARILAQIDHRSYLAREFPELQVGEFFELSGTSQAAAIVSGVAALVLQHHPWLNPDELKCRLLASAHAATEADGELAYSPMQQGAGLIDAPRAIRNDRLGCANRALSVDDDLSGTHHFSGPVRFDGHDHFHLAEDRFLWDGEYLRRRVSWNGGNPWVSGDPWIEGQGDPWLEGQSTPWADGDPWIDSRDWNVRNPWLDAQGDPWLEGSGDPWLETNNWDDPMWTMDLSEPVILPIAFTED